MQANEYLGKCKTSYQVGKEFKLLKYHGGDGKLEPERVEKRVS